MTPRLDGETSESIADGGARILAVPVGATEQHGPHLPLTTDTDLAVALAEALAAVCPVVAVGPPVAYGASGEHQGFAGTLSIGHAAARLLLVELGRSASATFERVLFISTHGGNRQSATEACALLVEEGRDVRVWSPAWGSATDSHAGHTETSLMLHLHRARVRMVAAPTGNTQPLDALMPSLRSGGLLAVTPSGVLGDATTASPVDGARILQHAVLELVHVVETWLDERP